MTSLPGLSEPPRTPRLCAGRGRPDLGPRGTGMGGRAPGPSRGLSRGYGAGTLTPGLVCAYLGCPRQSG